MKIEKIIDYQMDQNCYFVYEGTKGFLIDPGNCPEKIIKKIKECQAEPAAILLTHAHYDHICGTDKIIREWSVPVYGSAECRNNVKSTVLNVSSMFGEEYVLPCPVLLFADGETKVISEIPVTCLKTPGHTDCSVCYRIGDHVFSGDTLFLRSVGRWDFPNGNFEALEGSVKNCLYQLPDEVKVFPGHGNDTSIGYEKKFNLVIRNGD